MPDSIVEIVEAFYEKFQKEGPASAINEFLSDDFRLIAGKAEINRDAFTVLLTRLYAAVPDLTHTLSNMQVRGEVVQVTDQPAGTFTGSWDGSNHGFPVIPPHGKAFTMAPTKWEITVRHGKITRWHDVTVPSAISGSRGFLKALGLTAEPAKAAGA